MKRLAKHRQDGCHQCGIAGPKNTKRDWKRHGRIPDALLHDATGRKAYAMVLTDGFTSTLWYASIRSPSVTGRLGSHQLSTTTSNRPALTVGPAAHELAPLRPAARPPVCRSGRSTSAEISWFMSRMLALCVHGRYDDSGHLSKLSASISRYARLMFLPMTYDRSSLSHVERSSDLRISPSLWPLRKPSSTPE